ncbi:hypothetical protein [Paenibacillus sp. GCM10027629]|uniref:hypothetical protein n=1 Tax=Paenibacillus sp. GCM10027629 TaxID=3273414 RepID=UPI0036D3807C
MSNLKAIKLAGHYTAITILVVVLTMLFNVGFTPTCLVVKNMHLLNTIWSVILTRLS